MTKNPAARRQDQDIPPDTPEESAASALQREIDLPMSRYFDFAPGLFFTLRRESDGRMAMPFVRGQMALFHGLTAESVADDIAPMLALCNQDDTAQLLADLLRSSRDMTPCHAEFRVRSSPGRQAVVELNAVPRLLEGKPGTVEWHGFMHEVTERREYKAAQQQKAELQDQLSSIAQALPGFLYTTCVDDQGASTFPFASDGIEDLLGVSPEEIRNNPAALRARYHPDDLPRLFELIRESARTLAPFRCELRAIHPEHGMRWIEIRSTPRRRPDGILEAHGLMMNITERKQAEVKAQERFDEIVRLNDRLEESARNLEEHAVELEATHEHLKTTEAWYRGVLQSAPDGILVVNERGTIVLVNTQLCRMFGYEENELIGHPMEMLVPPDTRAKHPAMRGAFTDTALRKRLAHSVPNLRGCRKDGSEFPIDVSLAGLPNTDFSEGTICAAIRDVTERKRLEDSLKETLGFTRELIEAIPGPIFYKDANGIYLGCNSAFERYYGIPRDKLIGKGVFDLWPKDLAERYHAADRQLIENPGSQIYEAQMQTPEGRRDVVFHKATFALANGSIGGQIGVVLDITESKRMEEALSKREREFRTLVENTPDTVARFGRDLRRMYVNPALAKFLGKDASFLVGTRPSDIPGAAAGAAAEEKLIQVIATGMPQEFEYIWHNQDGSEVCSLVNMTPEFNENGDVETVLTVSRDISELNAFRQKIHQMAFYDSLTTLPNRALFNDRLRQMITDASWHGQTAGVMMIDMDRFKAVNDTMGHAVGDELLREAARRLTQSVRAYDTVARLGGDEFAILLPEIRTGADLGRIASKILAAFEKPFLLDAKDVFVSCSIGIALYPDDSADAQDLLKFADSAMYFAKRSGRNNFRFYSKDLTASAKARLMIESELRGAIDRNELELHYQPKILIQDGQLIGSEALLRWRHPQHGMVPPGEFIQIAEDTGLIIEIGKWVLRTACTAAAEWNAAGQQHKVAINLSARQFQTQDLVSSLRDILHETACRPEWIELEITESLLLDEDGKVLDILNSFRAMGITVAIDDFGTGYSALSYLTRFPIDTLKIDRSFINTVTADNYRAELVRAILSIARCLGQQVVAEGVETVEQAAFLEAHGCQVAQGFLYSKAVPKAEFDRLPRRFLGGLTPPASPTAAPQ